MFMRTGRRGFVRRGVATSRVARRRYIWEHFADSRNIAAATLNILNTLTSVETSLGVDITGWRIERVIGQITVVASAANTLNVDCALGVTERQFLPAAGYLTGAAALGGTGRYHSWAWYQQWREPGFAAVTLADAAAPQGLYTRMVDIRAKRLLRGVEDQLSIVWDNAGAVRST